jgi:putative transposase
MRELRCRGASPVGDFRCPGCGWGAAVAEMFPLERLRLPPSLHQCLGTTNLIESPQGGVAQHTGNVTCWRDQDMALRSVASAWLRTEKSFRKVSGVKDLWTLAVALGREETLAAAPPAKIA